jgi:hypothetical protein
VSTPDKALCYVLVGFIGGLVFACFLGMLDNISKNDRVHYEEERAEHYRKLLDERYNKAEAK